MEKSPEKQLAKTIFFGDEKTTVQGHGKTMKKRFRDTLHTFGASIWRRHIFSSTFRGAFGKSNEKSVGQGVFSRTFFHGRFFSNAFGLHLLMHAAAAPPGDPGKAALPKAFGKGWRKIARRPWPARIWIARSLGDLLCGKWARPSPDVAKLYFGWQNNLPIKRPPEPLGLGPPMQL